VEKTWINYLGHDELFWSQYLVPNFMSNSIALNAGDGNWTVISPGASLLDPFSRIIEQDSLEGGDGLALVMPNAYHFMDVPVWLDKYPSARLFASQQAIPALNKKGIKKILPLEETQPNLPKNYHLLFPAGHRGGDVWFVKSEGDAHLWITCDSFLNYKRLSRQPLARAMQKLLGAAPGLKISQVIKYFILTDKQAFKTWVLEHLEKFPPSDLIPAHGEPVSSEALANNLTDLITRRL